MSTAKPNRASLALGALTLGLGLALVAAPAAADEADREREHRYDIPTAPAEYQSLENPYTSERDVRRGKRYYKAKCAECHGKEGRGDPDDEDVPVFADEDYMETRSDGQLFYITVHGAGEMAEMEAWGPGSDEDMSEKRIWQIIAYIRTLAEDD